METEDKQSITAGTYPDNMRIRFSQLRGLGLALGAVRQKLAQEFEETPVARTLRYWDKDLNDDIRKNGDMDEKERRRKEYLWMRDEVYTHDLERLEEMQQISDKRGGLTKMAADMNDEAFLFYEQKEVAQIHRRVNDGLKVMNDEKFGSRLPPFIVLASQQSPEPPNGNSDSRNVPGAVVDAEFEQVADVPAVGLPAKTRSAD